MRVCAALGGQLWPGVLVELEGASGGWVGIKRQKQVS